MKTHRDWLMAGVLVLLVMAPIAAVDITGKWTASFDTQIGKQEYTYDFVVKGSTLTGKMKSNLGESDVLDGKVDGDKVSFGELLKFEGMEIKITCTGTIDEIKFTRNLADFATEELVVRESNRSLRHDAHVPHADADAFGVVEPRESWAGGPGRHDRRGHDDQLVTARGHDVFAKPQAVGADALGVPGEAETCNQVPVEEYVYLLRRGRRHGIDPQHEFVGPPRWQR
jgi:hypothetical protein